MKILVTGALGFIGYHLCKRLSDDGHHVTGIDDCSVGGKENTVFGVKYIYNDVCKQRAYDSENTKYDVIFHLAALSRIQPSFENPTRTFDVNTLGTQRMLEFARQTNSGRFIFAGSSSRHHDPQISPYALSKFLGEELCKMYRKTYTQMDIHIARFYNVYGPREIMSGDWAAVIGKWRHQVYTGEDITIVGNGEQRRAFTHVDDIVDGLIKIMRTEHSVDDAWELGTRENVSMNELFLIFKSKFPNIKCKYIPEQKGNYRATSQTDMNANVLLNWWPHKRLEDYIIHL